MPRRGPLSWAPRSSRNFRRSRRAGKAPPCRDTRRVPRVPSRERSLGCEVPACLQLPTLKTTSGQHRLTPRPAQGHPGPPLGLLGWKSTRPGSSLGRQGNRSSEKALTGPGPGGWGAERVPTPGPPRASPHARSHVSVITWPPPQLWADVNVGQPAAPPAHAAPTPGASATEKGAQEGGWAGDP